MHGIGSIIRSISMREGEKAMTMNVLWGIGIGFLVTSFFFTLPIPEWLKLLAALGAQTGIICGILAASR
jgi:hypothetical protein